MSSQRWRNSPSSGFESAANGAATQHYKRGLVKLRGKDMVSFEGRKDRSASMTDIVFMDLSVGTEDYMKLRQQDRNAIRLTFIFNMIS